MWSKILEEICLLLETYKGRDKILRTLSYLSKLGGGLHNNEEFAQKMLLFGKKMSEARATLRLFDDIPMLKYTLEYGLGKKEPDRLMAQLGVITNIIDQVYYPIEKMSWLAEHKLVTGIDNNKWDTISAFSWVLSIYLTLLRTFRYIAVLQRHKKCVTKDNSIPLEKILQLQKYEILTSLRLIIDLIHAVNTLPPGILWSCKLKTWQVGFIGTASSLLGIYQIFYKRTLK
ncbi:peroxisomal membrane protein 11C [Leptinotarsa decemlineata]|uniref:peroxisomal membrane protein 11C n=1 Tax=Leptinotarsa decemlineata TaxID=7539 RepID=UPI000C254678|nr:peroxisomal membrane protein 11C [Leptinotarsa decemlineata]